VTVVSAEATRSSKFGADGGARVRLRGWTRRHSESLAAAAFLTPNLVGFLTFTALPVLAALILAFTDYDLLLGGTWTGLDNLRQLASDDAFKSALINTIYFTVVSVPLAVGLGLAAAVLVTSVMRGATFFRLVFLMPYVTVTVALALAWKWIYQPSGGLLNAFLGWFGITGPSWLTSSHWAMPAMILMSVWKTFGYYSVIYMAGLLAIPGEVQDAARVDGATRWQRFRYITLPLLSPTTFFVVIVAIINSFQVFDQALVMTRGGPGTATTTLVLEIYLVGFRSYNLGYAAAIGLVLFACVLAFTITQFLVQRRWVYDPGEVRQ
jgi:multiple sugar transport system permease protein